MKVESVEAIKRPTINPTGASPDEIEDKIRRRAYELYERRGYQNGFELEDWVQAETEVRGFRKVPKAA